jgi:hypothetical protein
VYLTILYGWLIMDSSISEKEREASVLSKYPIVKHGLHAPPLSELAPIIATGLQKNFKHVTAQVVVCPDLYESPFCLATSGICGSERIADVGGLVHLHPTPDFTKKYSLLSLMEDMELLDGKGSIIGAAAGPFHQIGHNSELIPNLSKGDNVDNRTHWAEIGDDSQYVSGPVPNNSTDCGLMANLFASDGLPGPVLKITANYRTGSLNFTAAIQEALKTCYGELPVSMGGVFLIKKGKAKIHVMPDFCQKPLPVDDAFDWLRFFEMETPLVCLTVFHSYDPGWNLRPEHTHCFGIEEHGKKARGGHYHFDTTPEEVEYEAYLNTAKLLYRIDQPGN